MSDTTRRQRTDPAGRRRAGRPRGAAGLAALGVMAVLLAGCSASSGDSETGAAMGEAQSSARGDSAGSAANAADSGTAPEKATVQNAVQNAVQAQMLARTATLSVRVKDVSDAASTVRAAAALAGGQVTQEDLRSGADADRGSARPTGTIVIQVPGAKLDETLDQLARLGTVQDRQVGSEDVTTQVVDTTSRLATMRESVTRVRALMGQATRIQDIVALESELSQRESDLEALESQLAGLKGRVAMSPITISLWTTTPPVAASGGSGFVSGLGHGWHAFTRATAAVLTALGAVLPFAVLLALLGFPAVLWRRRRGRAAGPAPASPQG